MNDTPDGPCAPREAQMNTVLSNGSLNAHISLATVETEKSCSSPVAPNETQTDTILSNGSLNDHKSLVSVGTLNGSGAPKESQMETGLIDGSLNAQKSLAAIGIEENGFEPVPLKETQTNSNLSNGSLSGQKSLVIAGTMIEDFSSGASEPEQTQTKETSVSKSISDPSKTENRTKEESSSGNGGGDDCMEATPLLKTSDSPKMGRSMEKKAFTGTSLNQRKKKKHKRNKRVKNLAQENLVNEGSSLLVKIEVQETIKPVVDNGFKERVDEDGAVLAINDSNSGSQLNPKESNQLENCGRSLSQKDLVHMLTRGIDDRTVPRWDEDEPATSQIYREERNHLAIGYIGDEWGSRKKVKISKTEFDGKNSFQDIANARLKSVDEKQILSKTRPMMMKKKNKHSKKSRSGNGPYRI
ncbi:hypothetical protein L1987_31231 [Smallanthus sonchifolius]|uniref:Uncharacterized protein n=1 Tax=Smallanthus sonchifolius TaxID=185202 RepID=A0ACB9I5Y3_9ASTR|nr:hypothetical protein L1987_31231 [Smallanthus sonchifolius]